MHSEELPSSHIIRVNSEHAVIGHLHGFLEIFQPNVSVQLLELFEIVLNDLGLLFSVHVREKFVYKQQ